MASGKACRSSVVTSLVTKKLVVPVTSLGPASGLPSRAVSENFKVSARLNSVVASTFPRTERAGSRLMRDISPLKVASALSSLVIIKRAILLELFNHRIGHQDFDARHQRAILKRGHRNAVNVPEIVRLYRPDVISKATGDREAKDCRE